MHKLYVPTFEIVHSMGLAQFVHGWPIFICNSKPLTISGTNIDVDCTKLVVLFMSRRPATFDLCK